MGNSVQSHTGPLCTQALRGLLWHYEVKPSKRPSSPHFPSGYGIHPFSLDKLYTIIHNHSTTIMNNLLKLLNLNTVSPLNPGLIV